MDKYWSRFFRSCTKSWYDEFYQFQLNHDDIDFCCCGDFNVRAPDLHLQVLHAQTILAFSIQFSPLLLLVGIDQEHVNQKKKFSVTCLQNTHTQVGG